MKNIPLLNPTLVSVREGRFYLSSHTVSTAILYSTPIEGVEEFAITLAPDATKTFAKILTGKETPVTLKSQEGNLFVSVGKKKNLFTAKQDRESLKAAKILKEKQKNPTIVVELEEFEKALSATSHYAGDKTLADYRFHGFHFTVSGLKGEIMSSNNKGMSVKSFPLVSSSESDKTIILPKDIVHLIKGLTGKAEIELSENGIYIYYSSGETRYVMYCALVNSTPLGYQKILPKVENKINTIRVTKKEFDDAISSAVYFSPDDTYRRVLLKVQGNSMELSTANNDTGRMEASCEVEADKDDMFEVSYPTLAQLISNSSNDLLIFEVYSNRIIVESGSRNILAKFEVDNAST